MKKIKSNLLTTASLNIFTYLVPLAVTPYFLRIAGTENFAILSIAQSIIQYLILFVGFNLDASVAGEVAVIKEDKKKLADVFWQTTYARLLLLAVATFVFAAIVLFFLWNGKSVLLLNLAYIGLIGYAITPLWFYQGTESFRQLFLFVAVGKLVFAAIVFSCVTQTQDYWYYLLGLSLSQLLSGVALFLYPLYKYKFSKRSFHFNQTLLFLKQKFPLFKGGTMVNFCMNINVTVLSMVLSLTDFGLYMAANKLILVMFTLVTLSLNQSLYPYISRSITNNAELAILKIRKVLVPGVMYIALAACLLSFLLSKFLILTMLGPDFLETQTAFQLMALSLVANVLANVVTLQLFIKLNFFKAYSRTTQLSAIVSVGITFICAWLFGLNGAALAWLINEFFLLAYSTFKLKAAGIDIFHKRLFHPREVVHFWNTNKMFLLRR